jgi:hypothetical protein
MELWLKNLDLDLYLGEEETRDMWLTPATIDRFEFIPLETGVDIAEEASAMNNCVASYAWKIKGDESRIWSVRQTGERVGTLEVGYCEDHPLLSITEISGKNNTILPKEVWIAARRWLNSHDISRLASYGPPRLAEMSRSRWSKVWRPYWLAKRCIPEWLPLSPSWKAFNNIRYTQPPRHVRRYRRPRRRI